MFIGLGHRQFYHLSLSPSLSDTLFGQCNMKNLPKKIVIDVSSSAEIARLQITVNSLISYLEACEQNVLLSNTSKFPQSDEPSKGSPQWYRDNPPKSDEPKCCECVLSDKEKQIRTNIVPHFEDVTCSRCGLPIHIELPTGNPTTRRFGEDIIMDITVSLICDRTFLS